MVEGIDVYGKYQTVTDWAAVRRAGKTFCYVKVSDGADTRNDYGYVAGAKSAGLGVGGYHYAQFGDPVQQARILCNRVAALGALDLAPMLDLELPFVPGDTAAQFAVAFLTEVIALGHRPGLYGNDAMLSVILPTVRAAVPELAVWAARYGKAPTVAYDLWQHSKTGTVPGITGSVDLNTGNPPGNYSLTTARGFNDMPLVPYRLDRGAGRHLDTVAVEVGSNSALVSDLWVSLVTGFDALTDVAVTFPKGGGAYGGDGLPGTVQVGTVPKDERRWWKVPSGCIAVSLDYTCTTDNARPALAFAVKER